MPSGPRIPTKTVKEGPFSRADWNGLVRTAIERRDLVGVEGPGQLVRGGSGVTLGLAPRGFSKPAWRLVRYGQHYRVVGGNVFGPAGAAAAHARHVPTINEGGQKPIDTRASFGGSVLRYPLLAMTDGSVNYVHAKVTLGAEVMLLATGTAARTISAVEMVAGVVQNPPDAEDTLHVPVATVDATTKPYQIDYLREGDIDLTPMDSATGGGYIPPFHPILVDGGARTKFQPGSAIGTLAESGTAGSYPQNPDELFHEFAPKVALDGAGASNRAADKDMADALAKLTVAANALNVYEMEVTYKLEDFWFTGQYFSQAAGYVEGHNMIVDHYRIVADADVRIFRIGEGEATPKTGQDTLLVKYFPVATIDTRVNPPVRKSVPHGYIDVRRHPDVGQEDQT